MGQTTETIEYYIEPENDKDYLQGLLLNIKEANANQNSLTFQIVEPKEKGFIAKIGGLFAFISFNHFSWTYPTKEYWKNVSNSLVGCYFTGKIHNIEEYSISIQINAEEQIFDKPDLQNYNEYRGVIVEKPRYGLFVDLGLHFNWKFGSLLGLVHKSTLLNQSEYENWNVGEEISTLFQGFNEHGQLILGDNREYGKWLNGAMAELIGTIQKVNVVINENGKSEFYVLGAHKGVIPIIKEYYPNSRTTAKEYVYGLKNGEIIDCKVVKINKRKDSFVLKLLIEKSTD